MIPTVGLDRQYKIIEKDVDGAIKHVLSKGVYILSNEVTAFEKEFAAYVGSSYAVGVANGTDALTLALRALDIGPGDEVIVPANSTPSVYGVAMAGVTLKLIDCTDDANLDITKLEGIITKKTKAIILVHLYGNPADIDGVKSILKKIKRPEIAIVEDCAQAHGAFTTRRRDGETEKEEDAASSLRRSFVTSSHRFVGSFGTIGCFSFYPTKNLGCYGDGGMVVTDDKKVAEKLKRLRMYGEVERYKSIEVSGNSRLDELQAAVLRVKLKHLDAWNKKRREIAEYYRTHLSKIDTIAVIPYSPGSCHHQFVIATKKRDELRSFLEKHGILTGIHYPIPIHLEPSFSYLGYHRGDFSVSESLSDTIISLPMYPELTNKEIDTVIEMIKLFFHS